MANDDDLSRLAMVIERQRRELEALRASVDTASVIAMARGALMERGGAAPAAAAAQLADMAAATGLPLPEMAAAVLSRAPLAEAEPSPQPAGQPLRELLAITAADRATEGRELVGALADQVLDSLGATALAVWLLETDGSLELLGEHGLGGMTASRARLLPPWFDCPPQRVVQEGADLWWPMGRPGGDTAVVLAGRWGDEAARAVLGLRQRGAILGVLQVWWPGPLREFAAETRVRLSAMADGVADLLRARIEHGGLLPWHGIPPVLALLDEVAESVLAVQPVRDEAGSVADFAISHLSPSFADPAGRNPARLAGMTLLEAYPASTATGLYARAVRVLASGHPEHEPGAVETPLTGQQHDAIPVADVRAVPFFNGVVFTWRQDTVAGITAELLGHAQRLGQLGGWEEDLAAGAIRWTNSAFGVFGLDPHRAAPISTAELHNFVIAADRALVQRFRARLLRQREPASTVFRVVRPGDGAIRQIKIFAEPVTAGASVLALRGAFQDVSAHYHTQVALAATRDQLLDTEQRAAEEHQLAVRLQHAIMPPGEEPPAVSGVELAVRYRPVEPGRLVGGDWYDTVLLPSKELLVVVGDITGHGIDAVTGMVAARNALRGLAATGAGPAGLLQQLNHVSCHFSEGIAGTVICALYNPESRVLRWARAGHLPPVLVRDDAAATLPLPQGVLLGLDPDARYEEAVCPLGSGDMVLLFTDGLIERRGQSITDALAHFMQIAAPAAPDVDGEADRMLASSLSNTGDDACLVAMKVV